MTKITGYCLMKLSLQRKFVRNFIESEELFLDVIALVLSSEYDITEIEYKSKIQIRNRKKSKAKKISSIQRMNANII